MSSRLTLERVVIGVVALGMASFLTLHTFVLLRGSDEPTMSLVRATWFLGLGVLLVVVALLTAEHRNTV